MFMNRKGERGQMLVIVAVALTALVAMTGLVIDGGMALSNRRQVQNAADAASLSGTRVLGLDLKWRAVNASNPTPPTAPFADPDAEVCDAINRALGYNTNAGQAIDPIDCYTGTDDAVYVDFDQNELGRVGEGIPSNAQGVRVLANGESGTFLMGVVGINTVDVAADATALAGPAEPPLGLLMPFVVQNPLGPFVPGEQYQVRSESEGECEAALDTDLAFEELGITLASYQEPVSGDDVTAAPGGPSIPVAEPTPQEVFDADGYGWTTVTVTLSTSGGAKIHYTINGDEPTSASTQYTGPLTFSSTTLLRAVAIQGGKSSDIGNFLYAKEPPPEAVSADPESGTFVTQENVELTAATGTIHYTTDGTNPTNASPIYTTAIPINESTQLKAIAYDNFQQSPVSSWTYTEEGDPLPPEATPPGGEFETTQNVTLTAEPGATIYYTYLAAGEPDIEYVGPLSLVATTNVRAMAELDGNTSAVVEWTFTKTGETCPDLTAGNFAWIDFSGGSNSNADLIADIENPELADTSWYNTFCTGPGDTNCRDRHETDDPADDHWLIEGTTGHRDVSLRTACDLYEDKVVYVPIWDSFETTTMKPNGNNAVFHLIGFAAFRLDGTIDNTGSGDPSSQACGEGVDFGGTPNDKGFIGTYVDSFVGSQVSACITDGSNPCANLSNDAFTINLAR